jgi:hypothetical protein
VTKYPRWVQSLRRVLVSCCHPAHPLSLIYCSAHDGCCLPCLPADSLARTRVLASTATTNSDYHPDGAQLFWPREPVPFVVCLGPASVGDDVTPADMRAFYVPAGKGIYFHPGTWHNGVYIARESGHGSGSGPRRFLTRQGRVHARVSASWANEHGMLLRVPLTADKVVGGVCASATTTATTTTTTATSRQAV